MAVCWDDISHLSAASAIIREALKSSKMGVNHVAHDFVPKHSTNCIIKRGHNSYSRKCSILWIDALPQNLAHEIEQG